MANRVIFDIGRVPFGIGHPHLHIKCTLHVCRRIQGSQIFKWNSIILIRSKVMAFLVILLSPHGPHGPHIVAVIPVIPTSSPSSPHHPHSCQKVPMWSPWSVVSVVSVVSTCCLRGPHVIPIVLTSSLSSPHHLEGPHIIPNPPDTHSTHPSIPLGGGGPRISKNAIRFELSKIF